MDLCEAEPSAPTPEGQLVWSFAVMGKRRKLIWLTVMAPDEAGAIKEFRRRLGSDIEPYAGPLPQKCARKGCDEQAVTKIGKGSWLPVCQAHTEGAFPHHSSYE